MKRHGNLWAQITSLENIAAAHQAARRGKRLYTEVKMVDADPERYFKQIQNILISKTFTTSPYEVEERFDGRKIRTLHKLPYFPDRIVQHALLAIVGPILTRGLIRDTFQSIEGRGTSDAARRIKRVVRGENCPKYALKLDLAKYYPSVDHTVLRSAIRRKIKCKDTLWLIDDIINSTQGLPIGNYTSQIFGNYNLARFDWWIKQVIKPLGYFRYCDDIIVMDASLERLHEIRKAMTIYLNEIKLLVKPDWIITDIHKHGINFVGYVFRPESTRLRKNIARGFRKTCKKAHNSLSAFRGLMAYKGWIAQASAKQLWRQHTEPLMSVYPKQLRKPI